MAYKASILYPVLLLFMLFSPSLATFLASVSGRAEKFCNATPYPYFCKSSLPDNRSGSIYDYGRISIDQSLSYNKQLLSLVKHLLRLPSAYFASVIRALQDCQFLAQLNIDSLTHISRTVNYTDSLQSLQADDLQTLLSATLTNLDTCVDGLRTSSQASGTLNNLLAPLSTGKKHCSVSLAFFKHGWVPKKKKGRFLTERNNILPSLENGLKSGLLSRMSVRIRKVLEFASRRKLLQVSAGGVAVSQMVVVNRKGAGNFTSINDAVAAAPNTTNTITPSNQYFVIYVVKGLYNEYVSIPKNKQNIMMIGDGIGNTVITGNRSVVDGWTTFNSATFAVVGQGFVAVNITFRNTAGAIKQQAVAVRNGADMSAFYSCSFEGYQDTLYTHSLRQFYRDCKIYGTVDYIFGNAAVVFQNCEIFSRLPLTGQFNTITAQGRTDPNQNTGTSIQNCSIKAAKDLASSNASVRTYLGRPWKEYSRTVFMQSYIASLIDPSGWAPWSGDFALATLYYAEFNNTGAGSKTTKRVTWPGFHVINVTDAANFTVTNLTQGDVWLPATGVPFTASLI